MKGIFKLYIKLLKAHLLLKSHRDLLWLIMFSVILAPWLGSDIEILIYTIFSINILKDLDENKYIIHKILPISINQRIKVIYLSTFTVNMIGILASTVGYSCLGKAREIVLSLTIFLVAVILSNICYYSFCSSGFKEDIIDQINQNSKLCVFISAIVLVIIAMRFMGLTGGLLDHMLQHMSLMHKGIVISVLSIGSVVSTYISYQHMVYIVRS